MNIEAKFAAALRREKEQALNASKVKGKYKIQIWFKSDRSTKKHIAFSLSAWQSGMRLHGGGDEMMFFCNRHEGTRDLLPSEMQFRSDEHKVKATPRGCGLFIPGDHSVNGRIMCPHCGANHDAEHAAKVLVNWYRKLESCADLYAKYTPVDPRTILMSRSVDVRTARSKKGLTIYPWKNILEDTANGSSLESRFKAFILA